MNVMDLSIFKINNVNNCKFVQPSFGARYYYKDIKLVPGTRCACCGKDVIDSPRLQKAFITTTKPLKTVIGKGFLDTLKEKYSKIYQYLVNLANENPARSYDQIMQENDAEYRAFKTLLSDNIPLSDIKIQSNKKADLMAERANIITNLQKHIQNCTRREMKKAPAVIRRFGIFKSYLDGTKLDIFEQLEIYAAKYPHKTLSEIINMDDIYKFHKSKNRLLSQEYKEKRNFHLKNIEKMIKKANPKTDVTSELLLQNFVSLSTEIKDAEKRMYLMKQMLKDILNKNNCMHLEEKVMKELEKLPRKSTTKDYFFVQAKEHNFSDADIIYNILLPRTKTFDHTIARFNGGKDIPSNGTVMCKSCNEKKGSATFAETVEIHPEMKQYTQEQIDHIANYILKGKMHASMNFWPLNVSKVLVLPSENEIYPNIEDYCKKELRKAKARYKKLQFKHEILLGNQKRYLLELKRDKKNSKQIKKKINENKREIGDLVQQKNIENSLIKRLEEKLAEYDLQKHQ